MCRYVLKMFPILIMLFRFYKYILVEISCQRIKDTYETLCHVQNIKCFWVYGVSSNMQLSFFLLGYMKTCRIIICTHFSSSLLIYDYDLMRVYEKMLLLPILGYFTKLQCTNDPEDYGIYVHWCKCAIKWKSVNSDRIASIHWCSLRIVNLFLRGGWLW